MNRTRYSNLLSVVVLLGLIFSGCGNTPKPAGESATITKADASADTSESATTAEAQPEVVDKSQEPRPLSPTRKLALLESVQGAEDLLAWYALRADYNSSRTEDSALDSALQAKEVELREKATVYSLTDSLDLVAFEWNLQGEAPAVGGAAKFVASWLFYLNAPLNLEAMQSARVFLRGWPDGSHQHYLATEEKPDKRYFESNVAPVSGMETWKQGEYYLVTQESLPELPMIPYRMHTFVIKTAINEDGGWSGLGRIGESLDLGWHADLGDKKVSRSAVEAITSPDEVEKTAPDSDDKAQATPSKSDKG